MPFLGVAWISVIPGRIWIFIQKSAEMAALFLNCRRGQDRRAISFPRRNRIIAALARGIVVTEAKQKSGTLTNGRTRIESGQGDFCSSGKN